MTNYLLKALVYLLALLTFGSLFLIIAFMLVKGLPNLSLSLFSWTYTSDNVSLMPSIISTVSLVLGTLVLALPIGVFAGFYLVEYAKQDSLWVRAIRLAADTLSGIPSIVFGLFGMLFLCFSWPAIFSFIRYSDVCNHGAASYHSVNRRSTPLC